jgi:exonuclease III
MATLRNSIVSWNANSLNSAKHAELLALTADDPLCILLNETKHVNESDIKALPGYTAVSKRFMPRMSGLIVYVAERLSFVRRPDLELSPHVLAIECSLKGQHLVILGVLPPRGIRQPPIDSRLRSRRFTIGPAVLALRRPECVASRLGLCSG